MIQHESRAICKIAHWQSCERVHGSVHAFWRAKRGVDMGSQTQSQLTQHDLHTANRWAIRLRVEHGGKAFDKPIKMRCYEGAVSAA